ncbi:MAG: type I secretion system permease/ATPase [Rickettsiales bacterium]
MSRNKSQINEEKPLAAYLVKTKRALKFAFLFSFAVNFLMLSMSLYSLQVLDRVISSHSLETLFLLTSLVFLMLIVMGIFFGLRATLLHNITDWLDIEVGPELLRDAVAKSSLGMFVSAAQHQRDLSAIKGFISGGAVATALDAPWSILFMIVIYMISPVFGFITVLGLILLVGFGLLNEFATKKPFQSAGEGQILANQMADSASRNAEAVEAMGMMRYVSTRWQKLQDSAAKHLDMAQGRANVIQSISKVIRMILQISVTGSGAFLVIHNELTVGGMIAGSILVGRALGPFEGMIGMYKSWINTRDSYNRLNGALAKGKALERGTMEMLVPEGRLSVENLIFSPVPGMAPIIRGVSFVLHPGESLGIIGPSAAGKSTLGKLIIGLLPPTHGAARLDGADTFKWNRENFGKFAGYMPQSVELFTGTIRDNIARLDPDATDEEVIHAAQMAGAHDMILRLPKGYETVYQSGQHALSPGQRQRVALARALFRSPKFVVLDEPNTNLDGEGERALVETLKRMKQAGMTFVLVAHRPTLVAAVDKLLVLKAGTIERFGPRDDILKIYTQQGVPKVPGVRGAEQQQEGAAL